MKKLYIFILIGLLLGCKTKPAPVDVIFDTDLGNDVDDAIALVILHRYADMGLVNILAEGLSKDGDAPVRCMEIFNDWYGHRGVPVGTIRGGADCETDAVNYARAVAEEYGGEPAAVIPESHVLYRALLSSRPDHSVVFVTVGFSTNIARLLEYDRDLVARKAKLLVLMAGNFTGEQTSEYNVWKDIESARKVVEQWPGEIVFSPFELGIKVNYPGSVIEKSFAEQEPLTTAYKAYLPMPYDRPCWDPTALVYAAEGSSYFTESLPGTVSITPSGVTTFKQSKDGLHRILSVDDAQAKVLVDRIIQLTTK